MMKKSGFVNNFNCGANMLQIIFLSLVFLADASWAVGEAKSMIYGETGRLDRFDPYTVHESSGHRLSDLLFDGLVAPGPGGSYKPALAQNWDVRKGGTEVLVTLREGVRWHRSGGGTGPSYKVSPADVIATLRLIKNEKSELPNKDRFTIISSVKKIAQNKILFKFSRAVISPMRYLMFKILPHHLLGKEESLKRATAFVKQPVGTGPYKFIKYSDSGEVLLQANDEYFAGVPRIKRIIMKNYADQNIMSQSLMYGVLDLVTYVSPRSLDEVIGDKRLGVVPYDALSYSFIALNNQRKVLANKIVRQALSYAVNRQEMLDAFFYGKGRLISGPFAPTSWAYNMDVGQFSFDKKKGIRTSRVSWN
mgnify:CR=1 FL=1